MKKAKEHRYSITIQFFEKKTKELVACDRSVVRRTEKDFEIHKKKRMAQARNYALVYRLGYCHKTAIVRGNKWPKNVRLL